MFFKHHFVDVVVQLLFTVYYYYFLFVFIYFIVIIIFNYFKLDCNLLAELYKSFQFQIKC